MPTFSFVYERMRAKDATTESLWQIAEPVCNGAGYELVDIALVQSRRGWVLRVLIDHHAEHADPAGDEAGASGASDSSLESMSSIGFADCERVSRELSAILDVEDLISHSYDLEVSSPGLDRPLRKPSHFMRFLGQKAKITLGRDIGGRRNFTGTLVTLERRTPGESGDGDEARDPGAEGAPGRETGEFVVLDVDGTRFELPLDDVTNAKLVPDWDRLLKGKGGRPSPRRQSPPKELSPSEDDPN